MSRLRTARERFFTLTLSAAAACIVTLIVLRTQEDNDDDYYSLVTYIARARDKPSAINTNNGNNHTLPNPHEFVYLHNPDERVCEPRSAKALDLVAIVPSALENFDNRLTIRNTWANRLLFPQLRLVFLLGTLASNDSANSFGLLERLRDEASLFNDIVQEDFVDSYKNLSLKTMAGMRWVTTYCANAKLVLKVDDDVIVNIKKLYEFVDKAVRKRKQQTLANTFYCLVWPQSPPVRNISSRWYVSYDEYKPEYFPKYCDGRSYLFTTDLAASLFNASQYVRPLFLEDVTNGILASRLKSSFIQMRDKYMILKQRVATLLHADSLYQFIFVSCPTLVDMHNVWNNIYSHYK